MSEPFLAEIKMFGFDFPPPGFAHCDGQILLIGQNQSLFSVLGTTYGGDGEDTFALPDLRGRVPLHVGSSTNERGTFHPLADRDGEEGHALQISEMPAHAHGLEATDGSPASANPSGARLAPDSGGRTSVVPYGPATNLTPLAAAAVGQSGGAAHNTMQPFLAINFCIALQGLFPEASRSRSRAGSRARR